MLLLFMVMLLLDLLFEVLGESFEVPRSLENLILAYVLDVLVDLLLGYVELLVQVVCVQVTSPAEVC